MNKLRIFVACLAGTFVLPWFFLLIRPALQMSSLKPVPVFELDESGQRVLDDAGRPNVVSFYPPLSSGSNAKGQEIYVREGCAQCHSQLIRDDRFALDAYKREWGANSDSLAPIRTRPTNARDYLAEKFPVIGLRRHGGDLSNVALRFDSRAEMHRTIYDSRISQPASSMPAYRFLYETRKIEGNGPSDRALVLEGDRNPGEGFEVIPTDDAEALVDYLMSLNKNYTDPEEPVVAGTDGN